jgi:hypothetical protein
MSELHNDKPPVFKSWVAWYSLVLGALLLQVVLYLVITKIFS